MISIVIGTRPEIIKMAPVIRECEKRGSEYHILHTGQHYSYEMDRIFLEQLELPEAGYNLDVGSGTHAVMTGSIMAGMEKIYSEGWPDEILVEGDTNTVLAGALVGAKLHIKVGHVEAGLRSFDRRMPEEINRIVADHTADHLFAPTENSRVLLLSEGIPEEKVFVTGNTIVDSVYQNLEIAKRSSSTLSDLGLKKDGYILVTSHRAENVDDRSRFSGLIEGIRRTGEELGLPVIYPIHPRADKMLKAFGIDTDGVEVVHPVGFLQFLQLESNARIVLTDSGGVQEETCILGVPCVTLRDSTERPETIEVGSNIIVGVEPERIVGGALKMLERKRDWRNPFGDGHAAERIIDICQDR